MAFTELTDNLNTIEQLPDTPNRTSGYTAAHMKAFFDANAQAIKKFINETLIAELEGNGGASGNSGAKNIGVASRAEFGSNENIEDVLLYFYEQIQGATTGQIVANGIKTAMLDHTTGSEAVDSTAIRDGAVTNAKLAGGITSDKIASVLASALVGTITNAQLAGNITYDKLTGGIRATQLYGEIPLSKLASGYVIPVANGGTGTSTGAQPPKKTATVTLASGAKTWTVACSSVTASNTVIVGPAPASNAMWNSCGVYCSAQGSGTLTFTADSAPSSTITVNVLIFD